MADRRVAIVTGGADGIGRGIANSLAAAGYDLAIWDVNIDQAREVADELGRSGARIIAVKCDVSREDAVNVATEEVVAKLGTPYALVNNAGIRRRGRIEDTELLDWRAVMDVNLTGPFICIQAVGRHMLERKSGSIVNIASISGVVPQALKPGYSPTKAGLISLTEAVALEWGSSGIRCNAVSPAVVRVPRSESFYNTPEAMAARTRHVPLGRVASPADIGPVVAFLLSDDASFITGTNVIVDGGMRLTATSEIPTVDESGAVVSLRR